MAESTDFRAWELALGLLFEVDIAGIPLKDAVDASEELRLADAAIRDAGVQLAVRATGNRNRVETVLKTGVKHYELSRVSGVERSILRLAAAELIMGQGPAKLVIDFAARLARRFGGADSDRFVVGVLKGVSSGGGLRRGGSGSSESQLLGDTSSEGEPSAAEPSEPDSSCGEIAEGGSH